MSSPAIRLAIFCSAVVLTTAPELSAQLGGNRIQRPINTPTFSPYLNMFRNDNNSGLLLNYYGLVRPQMQAMEQTELLGQNLQALQLQQQQGRLAQPLPGAGFGYSQLGITGHPAVFQSFNPAGSSGLGGMAGGGLGGAVGFGGMGGAGGFGGYAAGVSGGGAFGGPGLGSGFGVPGGGGLGMPMPGYSGSMSGHPAVFGVYNNGR